jgi:hypothetical protein
MHGGPPSRSPIETGADRARSYNRQVRLVVTAPTALLTNFAAAQAQSPGHRGLRQSLPAEYDGPAHVDQAILRDIAEWISR